MSEAPPSQRIEAYARPAADSRARRWLRPLAAVPTPVIFVAAAAIATVVLWQQGGLASIGASIQAVPHWHAALLLLVYGGSILLLGVRWHVLARLAGGGPAWVSSTEVFLTSVIINYAAPIGLAVPTRAALTVRDLGLSPAQSGAVVGWELGLDIVALLAITAAWLALGGSELLQTIELTQGTLVAAGAAALIGIALLMVVSRIETIRARLATFLRPMLADPLARPGTAIVAVVLTGIYWTTQVGVMAALLDVFGVMASPSLVLGLMGLPVLLGMLSPIPGGAGVREALMAGAAGLEGVPAAPVVLAAVTYRLALFVVTPIVWAVLRLARPRPSRRP